MKDCILLILIGIGYCFIIVILVGFVCILLLDILYFRNRIFFLNKVYFVVLSFRFVNCNLVNICFKF